jgi:Predicted glycosyl hydrolase
MINGEVNHSTTGTDTIVYGFWPNWPYLGSYQPDWSTLTHVSYYKWTLNSDGTLTNPENMSNYYAVRDQAHQHGVKITLCIKSSDPYVIDSVIANHQTDFINNVSNLLQIYGADGVNLDLETPNDINSITRTSNVPLFENLMADLHKTLKAANSTYHISLDTPWEIKYAATFKNTNLKKYVDSVFVMSYDYCNRRTTSPNSPYDSQTQYDAIDSVSETSKYFNKNQIILGLPFYGYDYSTDSNQPGANITSEKAIQIGDAINNSQVYGRIWDSDSNTPWYRYRSGNIWHQVWYDDDESLRLKYQYIKSENLGGVGFWALGYERNYFNIWKVFQSDSL